MKLWALFVIIIFTPFILLISIALLPLMYIDIVIDMYKTAYKNYTLVNEEDKLKDHWQSKSPLDWIGKC